MITDEHGNKLPQAKISKKEYSRNIRLRRINVDHARNPAFCIECGYRIRGKNHLEGQHHKQA